MKKLMILVLCLVGTAGPVLAQDGEGVAEPAGPSERMLKRMKDAPDAFVADAAGLILGYGTDAGIDAAGIEVAITVDQAAARGREMGRLVQADLNGDGAADTGEIAVLVKAAAARRRGRLTLTFQAADADRDGRVTFAEMTAQAALAGAASVSPGKMAAMRGLLALDQDGDGFLTLAEVQRAVQRVQDAT